MLRQHFVFEIVATEHYNRTPQCSQHSPWLTRSRHRAVQKDHQLSESQDWSSLTANCVTNTIFRQPWIPLVSLGPILAQAWGTHPYFSGQNWRRMCNTHLMLSEVMYSAGTSEEAEKIARLIGRMEKVADCQSNRRVDRSYVSPWIGENSRASPLFLGRRCFGF